MHNDFGPFRKHHSRERIRTYVFVRAFLYILYQRIEEKLQIITAHRRYQLGFVIQIW